MMNYFENLISSTNNILWSYILVVALICIGLYFTFKFKFVQFTHIKDMISLLTEKTVSKDTTSTKGISSFQAFCISTASRVGTGNLAGIAIAISVGGPGAIFWMWLIALIGSASSFVESTLAQIYKSKRKDGYVGGPAYYMEKGLKKRWMGVLFAILITICFGLIFNSVQSNTISLAFEKSFGFEPIIVGIVLAIITSFIVFGGVKRIAVVCEFLVPIMAIIYILISFYVILSNLSLMPSVINEIFASAFGIKEVIGGTLGGTILIGIKRGLFSNEAGMGSAPNAAAAAETTHPVKQGLIQTLGVFTDTIIICSCTAFIILLSGTYTTEGLTGIQLTQAALGYHLGNFGEIFISICILLFAFSSIIGNYYYGESNISFIKERPMYLFLYRALVIVMVFLGSILNLELVWGLADLFMGLMALINLIAIVMLSNVALEAFKDYRKQKLENKNPVFNRNDIKIMGTVDFWNEEN